MGKMLLHLILILLLLVSCGEGNQKSMETNTTELRPLTLQDTPQPEPKVAPQPEPKNEPEPQPKIELKPTPKRDPPPTADDIPMVFVQGGTFIMGCTSEQSDCETDEKPTHSVTLSSYYIGKYEITQAQWKAVMGSNPSEFLACDDCPVEKVSWADIHDFIINLNSKTGKTYRLPTEAEWEYAARGGNKSMGYKYSGRNSISSVAWYINNSGSTTHPVGQKTANELGIYDMSGNVWEWCSDWYGPYSSSSQTNPKGSSSGTYTFRVLRGGSWDDSAMHCYTSSRDLISPSRRYNFFGFRLVLVA